MKNILLIAIGTIVALPTIAIGASFTSSLIAGLSPEEAVGVLATQIDSLSGRVDVVETKQSETASTTDTLLQSIDALGAMNSALKASNETLKAKIEEVDAKPPVVIKEPTIIQMPAPVLVEPIIPAPPQDITPPVVNLQSLAKEWQNSKFFSKGVYGTAGIQESDYIKDAKDISAVEWSVDGVTIELAHQWQNGNVNFALDTMKYSNGEHQLSVKVSDGSGNVGSDSITITINNP